MRKKDSVYLESFSFLPKHDELDNHFSRPRKLKEIVLAGEPRQMKEDIWDKFSRMLRELRRKFLHSNPFSIQNFYYKALLTFND